MSHILSLKINLTKDSLKYLNVCFVYAVRLSVVKLELRPSARGN